MEGGRPLGRKNQRGHDAGGRRSGAGRPRKGEEGSNKRIRTGAPSDAERLLEQEEKRKQEKEREKVERDERIRLNRESYIEELRDVAYQHANEATADAEDEDEDEDEEYLDDYMTYDDDNETRNDKSNEDANETQNDEALDNGKSRKQRNRFVIEDSPISKEMNRMLRKVDEAESKVSDMRRVMASTSFPTYH